MGETGELSWDTSDNGETTARGTFSRYLHDPRENREKTGEPSWDTSDNGVITAHGTFSRYIHDSMTQSGLSAWGEL